MNTAAAPPQPWQAAQAGLLDLRAAIAAAHQSGLQSIGANDADALTAQAGELSRVLALHLPTLQAAARHSPAPPEAAELLQHVGRELQALLTLNTQLSARTQRALDVLFPTDHVKAYSRLAGRASPFANTPSSVNGARFKA
jgi:hypothetical protein